MNERVSKILNNPLRVPISIGVVAFGAGVGLGYILGRRNRIEVHEIPDQLEIDFNVDELLQLKNKETTVIPAKKVTNIPEYKKVDGRYVKVIEEEDILPKENNELDDSILRHPAAAVDDGKTFVANKIKEAMTTTKETAASTKEVVEDVLDEVVTHSIFANDDDDWNYAREVKKRTPAEPYVIHKDEFYSDEKGYLQSTLIYYSGDNILCDEDDTPVYNHDRVTGPLLFGHGSGDPNVVHIRNDNRKSEYEILYDPGLYSETVLGLEIEDNHRARDIEHSKRHFRLE